MNILVRGTGRPGIDQPGQKATFGILLALLLMTAAGRANAQQLELVDAFPGLTFNKPLFLVSPPDGSHRIFVVQQDGFIKVFPNDQAVTTASTFLDLSLKISSFSGEEGLLGLAFPPDYSTTGVFYVDYTAFKPGTQDLQVVIARYRVSPGNPNATDPASEVRLLTIDKPYKNHNGGMITFGPDSYLYIGVGDGGSSNDPSGNGQNRSTLLGKILRIDVSGGGAYRIPPDNPFVGNSSGFRQEIWAYGLRNPWRFSFDPATGQLWVGDVGQAKREEVDIVTKGGNYGWKLMEGRICGPDNNNCDSSGLIMPIKDYGHDLGISITGGYVYRGNRRPDLTGAYIYGDYYGKSGQGPIWMLRYNGSRLTADSLLGYAPTTISSFGVDDRNELHITGLDDGRIYRFKGESSSDSGVVHTTTPALLQQNIPNPSTAVTQVSFRVINPGSVSLRLYDLLGREVAVVVDKPMDSGSYTVTVDTTPLASGVYFYQLMAPGILESRRMIVVR